VTASWSAFVSASDALSAAVEMQQAIERYNRRPDAVARLSVRIGVSVGDVSWDAGECFGTPMVEAARLEAVAQGGQIVCSDFVRVMKTYRETHPKKVYRDISNSILGQRIFRVLSDLEVEDPDRYTYLRTVLLDAGPALEDAVDLDDPETVERLEALLDRVEERLRARA
jgi:Adenylate cyclase, family 3 (some proteins contain HAMP domain)